MKRVLGVLMLLALAGEAARAVQAAPAPPPARKRAVPSPAPAVDEGPLEAVIEAAEGSFTIRLLADIAPRHVRHFVKTARGGGFDGTTFHRIVPRGIIQGGDPLSKDPARKSLYGTGGLGLLKSEFSPRPMARGAVAAVLRPRDPDSAGNQFFVVLSDQPSLTGKFTIFGEVTSGMDVVDRIGETPVEGDKPVRRIVLQKVTIRPVAAAPPLPPSPSPAG